MAAPTSSAKLRVMVDANVLVAGTGWPRFPYEVLQHAAKGDYQLVLSPFVIDEARTHLGRIDAKLLERFDAFLDASEYKEIPTPSQEELTAQPDLVRDVEDIPVGLAAINAKVDMLVSLDKDLTDQNEPIHHWLKILLPGTFLREYMGWTSEQLEVIRKRNWKDLE